MKNLALRIFCISDANKRQNQVSLGCTTIHAVSEELGNKQTNRQTHSMTAYCLLRLINLHSYLSLKVLEWRSVLFFCLFVCSLVSPKQTPSCASSHLLTRMPIDFHLLVVSLWVKDLHSDLSCVIASTTEKSSISLLVISLI